MAVKRPDTPRLKSVRFVRAKGKLYAYFNTGRKVAGKTVYAPLPPFGSPGFYETYAAMMAARTRRGVVVHTVQSLTDEYLRSPELAKLAPSTQRLYRITLKRICEQIGKVGIDRVSRQMVRGLLETQITGNGARNIFLAVTGILYKWARGRDLTSNRPTDEIKPYTTGEHDPWPPDLLQTALASDDARVSLAVHLLFYTGLRIDDAIKLRWTDVKDGRVVVVPGKTKRYGKELDFPQHADLRALLDRTPRTGMTILCAQDGKPLVNAAVIRKALQAFAAEHGVKVVPHGLRKNAVNALLEAGCTIAEVAAITGQSFGMVEHYAKRVDGRRLGEAAILKLERRK